jgi:hypothetical protein
MLRDEALEVLFQCDGFEILHDQICELRDMKQKATIRACNPKTGEGPTFLAGELNGIEIILDLLATLEKANAR